jgi:hypothetical protein
MAGTKMNRQNVIDDFIAAAEYLIEQKYTSAEKLAIAVYFAGCKEYFAKAFPKIFKKNEDKKAKPDKAVWLKSLDSLADGLPNYDAILDTRLNLVFFHMSQRIEANERMKAEMEAQKSRR